MDFLMSYKLLLKAGFSLPLLIQLYFSLMDQESKPKVSKKFSSEYDYIIVGAGAAGSVLANRLSEEKCVSVLLLEAGGQPPRFTDVPSAQPFFVGSYVDWNYETVPQNNTGYGQNGNLVIWPSGKALGGSTIINGMLVVRGSRDNYNDWEASGAKGWGWKDVLPYFLKLEDNTDKEYINEGFHNVGGPVTMERPRYRSNRKDILLQAVKESGFKMTDSNGARMTGFYDYEATIKRGQRCSAAKAYLVPASRRKNLHILKEAFATKILLSDNRATGVQFKWRNRMRTVKARREVILSAGTVNSAQLLLLSGIGPREHLDELGIPVVKDLNVGLNFQDHPALPVYYVMNTTSSSITEDSTRQYIHNGTGYLASVNGVDLFGFLNTRTNCSEVDRPNIQIYFYPSTTLGAKSLFGMTDEVYNQVYRPYENQTLYMCHCSQTQPKSRGWVRLRSKDPFDSPLINPNYYGHPDDVADILKGMTACKKIFDSPAMQKLGLAPLTTVYKACEGLEGDKALECHARLLVNTLSHQVGTAKMGDPDDPTTVVDTKLRVKGVKGLRVVDASIMPIVPSGNTMIPVYMVAEKASDIIKEEIRCGRRTGCSTRRQQPI